LYRGGDSTTQGRGKAIQGEETGWGERKKGDNDADESGYFDQKVRVENRELTDEWGGG